MRPHIGIHRHPEILRLDFAGRGVGHRHGRELEIFGIGHADGTGFQTDCARRDLVREPSCCRISEAQIPPADAVLHGLRF